MKIRVFPLEFRQEGSTFFPKDPDLHKLAVAYADAKLAKKVTFTDFRNVWATCVVNNEGRPTKVTGLVGWVLKADVILTRFDDAKSAKLLIDRQRSFLQDSFSAIGAEALVHISDLPDDQMCPKYRDWLKSLNAEPAGRWSLTI